MRKLLTPIVCVLCALSVAGQNTGTLTLIIQLTDSMGFPIPEAAIKMVVVSSDPFEYQELRKVHGFS